MAQTIAEYATANPSDVVAAASGDRAAGDRSGSPKVLTLGDAAGKDVGTGSGDVAAGDAPAAAQAAAESTASGALSTHAGTASGVHGITAAAATVLDDATVDAMLATLGGTTPTGTGAIVRANSPTLVTPALGTPASGDLQNCTALNASQLTSGTIPAARIGADTIDALTEIAAALKAGTGSKLVTNGNDASVPVYTEKHSTSHTIDAAECYGGIHYVTGAATITLPAVAAGMQVTIVTVGAVAVSVDPNASDLIMLDGTALDDGDKLTNSSTSGDTVTLAYYDATGWYAITDGNWTDGGA